MKGEEDQELVPPARYPHGVIVAPRRRRSRAAEAGFSPCSAFQTVASTALRAFVLADGPRN